jgi:hypothetical protein
LGPEAREALAGVGLLEIAAAPQGVEGVRPRLALLVQARGLEARGGLAPLTSLARVDFDGEAI